MEWIEFAKQQPDPIDGHAFFVVHFDGEEMPNEYVVQVWEWTGCYYGNCEWNCTEEMVENLGGMPTHFAYIDLSHFWKELKRTGKWNT